MKKANKGSDLEQKARAHSLNRDDDNYFLPRIYDRLPRILQAFLSDFLC